MELLKIREALEKDAAIAQECYTEFPEHLRKDKLIHCFVQRSFFVVPKQEGVYNVNELNQFLDSLVRDRTPNSIRHFSERKGWVYRGHKNIRSEVLIDGTLPILLDLLGITKFRGTPIKRPAIAVIYPLPDMTFYNEHVRKDNTDYMLFKRLSTSTLVEYQMRARLQGD